MFLQFILASSLWHRPSQISTLKQLMCWIPRSNLRKSPRGGKTKRLAHAQSEYLPIQPGSSVVLGKPFSPMQISTGISPTGQKRRNSMVLYAWGYYCCSAMSKNSSISFHRNPFHFPTVSRLEPLITTY